MVELLLTDFAIDILVIAVSLVALNWASNLAINNAVKVATVTRLGKTAVGFSMIAFSTSLPELTVAFIASLSGRAELSVGNVLGSNIFNISVIIGLASILLYMKSRRRRNGSNGSNASNGINVIPAFAKSELSSINFGLFISSIIPIVLIYIKTATWIVGLVLISIFIAYMYQLSKVRIPPENGEGVQEGKNKLKRYLLFTIVGALGVVIVSYFLVESAVGIAQAVGIPQTVIGATIIAVGTSVPELTLDLKSFLKGHAGLAFGDLVGSSFVNITLILGITLFIPVLLGSTAQINMTIFQNLVIFSIIINLFFWYFLSRKKISWKEGAVFLFIYGLFLATLLGFA